MQINYVLKGAKGKYLQLMDDQVDYEPQEFITHGSSTVSKRYKSKNVLSS